MLENYKMENSKKDDFYVKVTEEGPYLLYGTLPIEQEIILPNRDGGSWSYKKGKSYNNTKERKESEENHIPCALCRCGESKNAPFCTGAHYNAEWDPTERASFEPILDNAKVTEGPSVILADNEKYCAYARFCDSYGTVWGLAEQHLDENGKATFKHEVEHCPSGRLIAWDRASGEKIEPSFTPAIGVIQDPQLAISGPLWLKGGIRVESTSGRSYEVRNRTTLCRCGNSRNKPFCDGSHASVKYYDGQGFGENK